MNQSTLDLPTPSTQAPAVELRVPIWKRGLDLAVVVVFLPVIVPLAAGLALFDAWGGITLAYYTNWPTSFWITALAAVTYGLAAVWVMMRTRG